MNLYEKFEVYSPIYKGGLTNHLPMVITALINLEVNDENILNFAENYIDHTGIYELTDPTVPKTEFEQEYINKTNHYQYLINKKGVDVVLGEFLSKHAINAASGLFHGIIRLAYAVTSKNELYISQALSYYELISQKTQTKGNPVPANTLQDAFDILRVTRSSLDHEFKSNRTMEKFAEIRDQEGIKGRLSYPTNAQFALNEMLDLFAKEYLRTSDFYILHVITGFEALLQLEEFIVNFNDVLVQFYLDSQLMMLLTNSVNEIELVENPSDFESLKYRITELTDAHDIKLFFSLYNLNKRFDNSLLIHIANKIWK